MVARMHHQIAKSPAVALTGIGGRYVQPAWLGLSLLGLGGLAYILAMPSLHGADAVAYWLVDPANPYANGGDGALGGTGAFRYSPAAAIVLDPLGLLPWPVFIGAWTALAVGALWVLGGRWALALLAFPAVWLDVAYGNVNVFLAVALVAGLRWPATWSVLLLTKVTPGAVIGWYVGRRDWRALAIIAGVVGVAVLVSSALTGPGLWVEWVSVLAAGSGQEAFGIRLAVPLLPRLVVAFALSVYAGMTDRAWLLPIAMVMAMPVLWPIAFAPLVAWVRLGTSRPSRTPRPRTLQLRPTPSP